MRLGTALIASALAVPAPALAQDGAALHDQFRTFEEALDRAVASVSHPAVLQVLGGAHGTRGYYLRGYGAVFVVPPRALPMETRFAFGFGQPSEARLNQAIASVEHSLARAHSDETRKALQNSLASLKRSREQLREEAAERRADTTALRASLARQAESLHREVEARRAALAQAGAAGSDKPTEAEELRALEAEVEQFRREAERARAEAEDHLEAVAAEIRARIALESSSPAGPPEAPEAPEAPEPPQPPAPPAPWAFWFESSEPGQAGESADTLVDEVRGAVSAVLESRGAGLTLLAPDDSLVVAVDFIPRTVFLTAEQPQRTLVLRVRRKELVAGQAGKLGPEELRKRIESAQY
jgi:hypothetical protein